MFLLFKILFLFFIHAIMSGGKIPIYKEFNGYGSVKYVEPHELHRYRGYRRLK